MNERKRLLRGIYPERSRRARNDILTALLIACVLVAAVFVLKGPSERLIPAKAPAGAPDVSFASENKEPNANESERKQEQEDPNESGVSPVAKPHAAHKVLPPDHNHPAFSQRVEERAQMVAWQIKTRDVNDPNVLKAMQIVPRHAFVRAGEQRYAYADYPLPIGYNQTISQPYIVAFMTEALQLDPNDKVLEIGTGSGYQAAVCAEIAREVYTIEIVEGLAKNAKKLLKELGYRNVFVRAGDGYFGWPEKAPFDAIIGTAAAGRVPPPLIEQLKPGGRMILPVEGRFGFQYLVLITKNDKGNLHEKNVMPVRFVPMTGRVAKPEETEKK